MRRRTAARNHLEKREREQLTITLEISGVYMVMVTRVLSHHASLHRLSLVDVISRKDGNAVNVVFAQLKNPTTGRHMHKPGMSSNLSGKRLVVKSGVKGGGLTLNHNAKRLVVKSGVKGGGLTLNHNAKRLVVKSGVKGGGICLNHNAKRLVVKSGVKGGGIPINHNAKRLVVA
jgi:hypothetical protein